MKKNSINIASVTIVVLLLVGTMLTSFLYFASSKASETSEFVFNELRNVNLTIKDKSSGSFQYENNWGLSNYSLNSVDKYQ